MNAETNSVLSHALAIHRVQFEHTQNHPDSNRGRRLQGFLRRFVLHYMWSARILLLVHTASLVWSRGRGNCGGGSFDRGPSSRIVDALAFDPHWRFHGNAKPPTKSTSTRRPATVPSAFSAATVPSATLTASTLAATFATTLSAATLATTLSASTLATTFSAATLSAATLSTTLSTFEYTNVCNPTYTASRLRYLV